MRQQKEFHKYYYIVIMYKLIIVFILSIVAFTTDSFGQEDWEIERNETVKFSNTLDSLFLASKYEKIIEMCSQSHPDYLNTTCKYNLIATYYFLGDSVKSWELLNKEIDRIKSFPDADAYSLDNIFSHASDCTSFKKFLIESSVKNYLLGLIDSFYMIEPVADKINGIKLLHLLIEDQWVRRISSIYDKLSPERKFPLPAIMDSMQAIQAQRDHCTKVFNFYKKHNKVFSKIEVGWIYHRQKFLFFHEWDSKRREFYYKIVKQAVEDGILKIEDQMNFEAATMYIHMGSDKYFKHLDEIQEEFRKKYSKPDFRIQLF